MNDANPSIDELVTELEQAATRLRQGELNQGEAAELVERCADLANRVGAGLEREARDSAAGEPPGQEQLL
jgi:hypothetical protein